MEDQVKREPLYQVWVIENKTGALIPFPFFPRVMKDVADEYVGVIKSMISTGKEKRYTEPQALVHMAS